MCGWHNNRVKFYYCARCKEPFEDTDLITANVSCFVCNKTFQNTKYNTKCCGSFLHTKRESPVTQGRISSPSPQPRSSGQSPPQQNSSSRPETDAIFANAKAFVHKREYNNIMIVMPFEPPTPSLPLSERWKLTQVQLQNMKEMHHGIESLQTQINHARSSLMKEVQKGWNHRRSISKEDPAFFLRQTAVCTAHPPTLINMLRDQFLNIGTGDVLEFESVMAKLFPSGNYLPPHLQQHPPADVGGDITPKAEEFDISSMEGAKKEEPDLDDVWPPPRSHIDPNLAPPRETWGGSESELEETPCIGSTPPPVPMNEDEYTVPVPPSTNRRLNAKTTVPEMSRGPFDSAEFDEIDDPTPNLFPQPLTERQVKRLRQKQNAIKRAAAKDATRRSDPY